jgi:hypothetical protein
MFSDPGHFKAPNAFEQFLNRFSNYILQHSPGFFTPSNQLQDMDNTISEALKNLEAHYSKIIKTYNPEPYLRKVVLFKAQEFPPPRNVVRASTMLDITCKRWSGSAYHSRSSYFHCRNPRVSREIAKLY